MSTPKKMLSNCGMCLVLIAVISIAVFANAQGSAAGPLPHNFKQLPDDLSKAVVDSTMREHPSATELGKWGYTQALYLYGEYLVYERTHDPSI